MTNEISFFDLDGTLWNIDNDIYIIDKEKPYKKLLIIPRHEYTLIKNGFYRKDGVKIDYNGEIYYISKKMLDIVSTKAKTENPERFGISFINYNYRENLNKSRMKFLLGNVIHLSNDITDIGILTARYNQRNHSDLLNKLRLELKDINLDINKIYFVSDKLYSKTPYFQSMGKMFILLEHLIGLKIKDGLFIDEEQDIYKVVNFYDDDIKNIDVANSIMFYLSNILYNLSDTLHEKVTKRIINNKLILNTFLISNNTMNPFKKNTVEIVVPVKYPIYKDIERFNEKYIYVKKYNDFKK